MLNIILWNLIKISVAFTRIALIVLIAAALIELVITIITRRMDYVRDSINELLEKK